MVGGKLLERCLLVAAALFFVVSPVSAAVPYEVPDEVIKAQGFSALAAQNSEYAISLTLGKKIFCINESVALAGTVTEDGGAFDGSGKFVALYLYRAAETGQNDQEIGSNTGVDISSAGMFNYSGFSIESPGRYKIKARYTDTNGKTWEGVAQFHVLPKCVDKVYIYSDKASYYQGEEMTIYVEALKKAGNNYVGVEDFEGNWTLRHLDNTILAGYQGTGLTDSTGKFNITKDVPSAYGKYVLEVNNFTAMSTIEVLPFKVIVTMKDGTGQTVKSTYTNGQSAMVEVRVTKNGTTPTGGTYSFHGQITTQSGEVALIIPSTELSNTTYSGSYTFQINTSFFGNYMTNVTVENSETMEAYTFFDVRNWDLSLSKPAEDSGFLAGYTAFPGATVKMIARVTDLSNGKSVTADSISARLESSLGETLANSTPVWDNKSNGYLFSITMPSDIGSYVLKVTAQKGSDILAAERVLKVTDIIATATPSDNAGNLKEIFGGSEPVYFVLKVRNSSGYITVTDITLTEVLDDEGKPVSYTEIDWGAEDNTTTLEWQGNTSVSTASGTLAMVRLDNPRQGGRYMAEISLNNQTANAEARFLIDPYAVCARPTSAEQIGSSYSNKWRFSTDEKVRFSITVAENKPKAGSEVMLYFGGYNFGKCVGSEVTTVQGANVTITKAINELTREEIPISDLNITSGTTDSNGTTSVMVIPADGKWTGGWYQIVFGVTGPDGVTTGKGWSGFYTKNFYIWGHGVDPNNTNWYKWRFKPRENVTMKVRMFNASNNYWWYSKGSSGGLSGTVTVTKILYHGTTGDWLWPPVEYSYTKELPQATVTDGTGYFNLTAPDDGWDAGSYSIVLRGVTEDGDEDYGEAWFEVRLWEAWASLVEVDESDPQNPEIKWKSEITPAESASLLVRIYNSGNWWDYNTEDLYESPVSVGIEKIKDYYRWPYEDLDESEYTFYSYNDNSSQYLNLTKTYGYSLPVLEKKKYVLQVEPNSTWSTGYFNPVLNLTGANGSHQTGWGWFRVKAFHTDAVFVNSEGKRIYTSRGGNDIYFNVSATNKSWNFWSSTDISSADPINATITSITIRTWSEDKCYPIELQYPGDLDLDTADVENGMARIKINRTNGKPWATGWYSGEMVLESGGYEEKDWIWFNVRPFYVYAYVVDSSGNRIREVGKSSNVSINLTLRDPEDWTWPPEPLPGNYTIASIEDSVWNESGYTTTELTEYSPQDWFQNGSILLNVSPPSGSWTGGNHNLKIKIEDNESRDGTGWAWFQAVPFKVEVISVNDVNGGWGVIIKPGENLTVLFNVTDPLTGAPANATLEDVYDWSHGSHNFTPTEVNGTGAVNVSAPSEGWSQGWHYLYFKFEQGIKKYVWFEVRTFVGYVKGGSAVKDGNVSLTIYVYDNYSAWDNNIPTSVNVTNVTYINTDDYGWWYKSYTEANFTANNPVTAGGTIKVHVPPENWTGKYYDVRVYVSDPAEPLTKAEFYSWFYIVKPEVWISYPYTGATLTGDVYLSAYVSNDPQGTVSEVEFYICDAPDLVYAVPVSGGGGGASASEIAAQAEDTTNCTDVPVATANTSSYNTWSVKWDSTNVSDGTYVMRADAKGSSGNLIESDESGSFEIYNPAAGAAEFSGSFSDSGRDTTGDGLYDYLAVDVGVEVSTEGYYYVYGYLYTDDGEYIDYAYNYTKKLAPGTHDIGLNFEGEKVRASKKDGPYSLKYVYLYDKIYWTQLDYIYKAYNTSNYSYTEFTAPDAELTEVYTDLTTLGNGSKYDNVTFGIGVNVLESGDYRLEGYVEGVDRWIRTDLIYLSNGTYTLSLVIDGLDIYLSGYDGNYTLDSIYLYDNYYYTLDYDYPSYSIGPYNSADFRGPGSDNGILNISWSKTMQPGVTRMEFGASPSIGDINSGTPELEIVTGSDEYCNTYPDLNYTHAHGIWRAFDSSGTLLWARDTETDESRTSPAIIDIDGDGSLDIAGGTTSGWNVEVMNSSGEFIWTFPSPPKTGGYFLWHSSPAVADIASGTNLDGPELVIGNNWNGMVYAFDGNNNDSVDDGINYTANASSWYYSADEGTDGTDWDVLWVFKTGARVVSSPAVADINGDGSNDVVIGSGDSYIYALHGSNGTLMWKYDTEAAVHASAAIADIDGDGGLEVVIGSTDGTLYALNGSTGVWEWQFDVGKSIYSSAAVGDIDGDGSMEVIFGANDGNVYALYPSNGTFTLKWNYTTGGNIYSSPALANRTGDSNLTIYVGSSDRYLYVINSSGGLIDKIKMTGEIRTSPSVADIDGDGKLEVAVVDWHAPDHLWVLEDTGSSVTNYVQEWPIFRKDAARSGRY